MKYEDLLGLIWKANAERDSDAKLSLVHEITLTISSGRIEGATKHALDVLVNLLVDLEFFKLHPSSSERTDHFYGEERLREVIASALRALNEGSDDDGS